MLVSDILYEIDIMSCNSDLFLMDADSISGDSRDISGKCLFFAYRGTSFDSHSIVSQLFSDGLIIGAVCEYDIPNVPCIVVVNGRFAFSKACANYFNRVYKQMTLVGVTGTNGKTTVTFMLEKIFNSYGRKCVRVGTIGANIVGTLHDTENTTPSPYKFHKYLNDGFIKGANIGLFEISSHALEQGRLYGVCFDIAIFTNLSLDHLDYHKDMNSYFNAKKKLFSSLYSNYSVINTDDSYGEIIYNDINDKKFSYGINGIDLKVKSYNFNIDGISATLIHKNKEYPLSSSLVGKFNLLNILGAISGAIVSGVPIESAINGISELKNIPGRLERYQKGGVNIFIDYAHTPDALENVLMTLQDISIGAIITVFGAGGERDKSKRPLMGKIAEKYSDTVILTNDNPRNDEPLEIIKDILSGISDSSKIMTILERKDAITMAISVAKDGDVVLIAGKGHENYQIIGNTKQSFSDSQVVTSLIAST